MKLDENMMEDFNYTEGDLDTLKRRFFTLDAFLRINNPDAAETLDALSKKENLLDDPSTLAGAVHILGRLAAEAQTDDDNEWSSLYTGLFDSSPYWLESHYIPQPGEMKEITLLCMNEHKRIRTDIPEGAIA